jgi:hypothetical protein
MVIGLTVALSALDVPWRIVDFVWYAGGACLAASGLIAFCRALRGIAEAVRPSRAEAWPDTAAIVGNLVMGTLGMLLAYVGTVGFARGRQLRRFGRVLLPGVRSSQAWTTLSLEIGDDVRPPSAVADQWRENGRTEHASVAAFARVTLDLMALGAPPSLIAAANRDALDEIRHTELCFSLARAIDGRTASPGPFPQAQLVTALPRSRNLALATLAVDSLVDGALHEGVSARVIAKLARRCEVSGIRSALREIAADEGRHAAHGWAVVEWCLDEGGAPVAQALLGALRGLPRQIRSSLPEPASDGAWERWGIHGHALEAEEYAAALAHLIARVQRSVAERSGTAA